MGGGGGGGRNTTAHAKTVQKNACQDLLEPVQGKRDGLATCQRSRRWTEMVPH